MVIMAGGQGTRLRPHTNVCPKPLLTVNGAPILEHTIRRAKACGFRRFVISLGYLGHMIEEHFGDGSHWNVDIMYVREETPMGTAGALTLLIVPDDPFVVANGDILSGISYSALLDHHVNNRAIATMVVRPYEMHNPFGVVTTDGISIVGFEEKPVQRCFVNAGIYALDPFALHSLADKRYCDMPELFKRARLATQKTIVYHLNESWADLGTPADIGVTAPNTNPWHDPEWMA